MRDARPSDRMLARLLELAAGEGIVPPDPTDPRRLFELARELGHAYCGTDVLCEDLAEQLADGFAVALIAQLAAVEVERLEVTCTS